MVTIMVRSHSQNDLGVQYILQPDENMLRVYNDYANRIGYGVHNISIQRRHTHIPIYSKNVKELNIEHGEVFIVVGHVC